MPLYFLRKPKIQKFFTHFKSNDIMSKFKQISMHWYFLSFMLIIKNIALHYIIREGSLLIPTYSTPIITRDHPTTSSSHSWCQLRLPKEWRYGIPSNFCQLIILHLKYLISNNQKLGWPVYYFFWCTCRKVEIKTTKFLPNYLNLSLIYTILSHLCFLEVKKCYKYAPVKLLGTHFDDLTIRSIRFPLKIFE